MNRSIDATIVATVLFIVVIIAQTPEASAAAASSAIPGLRLGLGLVGLLGLALSGSYRVRHPVKAGQARAPRPRQLRHAPAAAALVALVVLVLSAGISVLAAAPATATTIAEWDLANATGQSADLLQTDGSVTATPIMASPNITEWTSTAQDGFIAASGWAPGLTADPAKYYEWTITPDPGFTISYETISLALFRGVQGGNHGAELWDLRASTDGFVSSDLLLQTFDISMSGPDEQIPFADADISGLGAVATTATFRLLGYHHTSASDFSGLGNDSGWLIGGTGVNPVVEGFVLAPEPGTALLVAVGFVILGLHRRQR